MLVMFSAMLTSVLLTGAGEVKANVHNFVTIPRAAFRQEGHPRIPELVVTVKAERPFTEVVASWKAQTPGGSWIEVMVKPESSAEAFHLGRWSTEPDGRTSIEGQKTDIGRVDTDTLVLAKPARVLRVRVILQPGPADAVGDLDELYLSLSSPATDTGTERAARKSVWGTTLEPPKRAQMSYPGGNVLCSPTSVSMVLGYWHESGNAPGVDADVPEVQAGVHDPAWGGTGNWSFNAAYAATRPGMTAYVARLRDVRDIEDWIAAKVPVITSISYALLKGEEKRRANDGHLVVVVGFDADGDPIFNDPGRNVVRMTYRRDDFIRAWAHSRNTVYLIYPKGHPIPKNGPWRE